MLAPLGHAHNPHLRPIGNSPPGPPGQPQGGRAPLLGPVAPSTSSRRAVPAAEPVPPTQRTGAAGRPAHSGASSSPSLEPPRTGLKHEALEHQSKHLGGPNGIRTRVSALRGPCRSLTVEQFQEPFKVQLGIANQPTQQTRFESVVIRDGQGLALRVLPMSQAEMAPSLTNHLIAETLECSYSLAPGDDGQLRAHCVTTTLPTNTCEGSGIGSPWAFMSSRTSSMASLIFASAFSTVSPSL